MQRAFNAQPLPHDGCSNIAQPLNAEKAGAVPRLFGEAAGTWPPPSAVKAGAASASAGGTTQTAPATGDDARVRRCQRLAKDPISLFMTPEHGPPAALRWRVTPTGIDANRRGWSVALTTDYAGLERYRGAPGLSRPAGVSVESDTRRIDAGIQINVCRQKGGRQWVEAGWGIAEHAA
ncbi:hypothetical protein [Sodalis glossinidius]|uniref:hypothetical protein n=1 Tax=Sodalis glossinidius TaxID=63612 RepID=UPI0011D04C88|nr:hypothetical protein [Sodalis glossinidius]